MNSLPSESSWHLQHLWVAVSDRSHVGPVPRNPKSANRLFETCPAARITVRGRGLPSGGFSARPPRQSLRVSVPDALRRRLRKHSSWIGPGDVSGAAGLRLRDERSLAREDVPGALGCLDQPAGQQEHDGYEESTEDQELKVHPAHGQRRPSRRRLPPGLLPLYPAFSPVRLPVHCYLSADSFRVRRYAAAPRFFRALRGGRSLGVPRPQNSNPTHVFSIIWGSAGTRYR